MGIPAVAKPLLNRDTDRSASAGASNIGSKQFFSNNKKFKNLIALGR